MHIIKTFATSCNLRENVDLCQPAPVFSCLPCSSFYCTRRDCVFVQAGEIKSFINSHRIVRKNFNPLVLCSREKRNIFFLSFKTDIFLYSRLQSATTSRFPQVRPAAVLAAPPPPSTPEFSSVSLSRWLVGQQPCLGVFVLSQVWAMWLPAYPACHFLSQIWVRDHFRMKLICSSCWWQRWGGIRAAFFLLTHADTINFWRTIDVIKTELMYHQLI